MPIQYRVFEFTVDTIPKVVLFSALTDDVGQTIPTTFTVKPLVDIISHDSRRLYADPVTTTGFTIQMGTVGGLAPFTATIIITNRDSTAVIGPTPTTDFSLQRDEPMCTPLDVRLQHKSLTPGLIGDDALVRHCRYAKNIILSSLRSLYADASLRVTPWWNGFFQDSIWSDPEANFENEPISQAAFGKWKAGFRGIVVAETSVFTQWYVLTFTSGTEYAVEGHIQGNVGSGNIALDFTAGNGDFTISSEADYGSFREGNRFHFAIYTWHPLIVEAATILATGMALQIDLSGGEVTVKDAGQKLIEQVMSEDENKPGILWRLKHPDEPGGMRLDTLGDLDLTPEAMPWDIDEYGRDITPRTERDTQGATGETADDFFDVF